VGWRVLNLPLARAPWAVTAAAAALVSLGVVGTDLRWMVPLGRLVAHGHLPGSLPFASAQTSGWHDVPALAELLAWSMFSLLGERGLILLQLGAVTLAWSVLARGLRRQGSADGSAALVAALVVIGCLPQLVYTRSYLFSLALFPVLVYLLEQESRVPSRRIWLAVPLVALWSNLHGGVLTGWAVLLVYLVLARRDRRTAAAVGVASTLALFATPVLLETPAYYRQVFENESARRHWGLWAPASLNGYGLALAACAVLLLALAVRGRLRLWEAVALCVLAAATVRLARAEPFLLFLAAYPGARALALPGLRRRLSTAALFALAGMAILSWAHGPRDPGSHLLARQAAASKLPVLADAMLAEQVELYGGTVRFGNPLDAFRTGDQRLYLDWLEGKPGSLRAITDAALVLVHTDSAQGQLAAHDRRLHLVRQYKGVALYRVGPGRLKPVPSEPAELRLDTP